MRIFVTTGHQYPTGTALTNRIRSYLEELAYLGHDVSVLIYRPSEDHNNVQNAAKGLINGVSYQCSAISVVRHRNSLVQRFSWIYSYLNAIRILYLENKRQHIDVVIQASAKSSIIPLTWLVGRLNGSKFVLENSEYPWFILKKGKLSNSLYKLLYLGFYYKLFDGVLAMTKALQNYHRIHSRRNAEILHLPMTVDIFRFSKTVEMENLITYIGNKSFYKDGVGILTEAFIRIASACPDWKLIIAGDSGNDSTVKKMADAAGMSDRIVTLGSVNRDFVPSLLCKSKILALARPDNKQSEGGFPTKLGEYLATGNLVVLTSVGEIPDYLEDGISALIASPGSVDSFANKLKQGIEHYEDLGHVRRRGFEVCDKVFNAQVQARRLSDYLMALCSK